MTFIEVQGDLFTAPQGHYLVHCISSDFALGAGIAMQFNNVFNMREKLLRNYGYYDYEELGATCLPIDNVYNLVTKNRCFDKPTLQSLADALVCMKNWCIKNKTMYLAMPKIGCGLDKLNWNDVVQIIHRVFEDTDVHITVYTID